MTKLETTQENFWQDIGDTAREVLGDSAKVYSAGRSAGWLVVDGLDDVDSWSAPMCNRWGRFARLVREDILDRIRLDNALSDIEANRWHLPGAERYNFIDTKDGETRCIAEMKADARAAGFGPIVRK